MKRTQAEEDDDMEVGAIELNKENRFKCPITGELLVDPVRKWCSFPFLMTSKECKHTYSKEGIMKYLGKKRFVICPIAGCGKKVTADSLEPDDDTMWKMVAFACSSQHLVSA